MNLDDILQRTIDTTNSLYKAVKVFTNLEPMAKKLNVSVESMYNTGVDAYLSSIDLSIYDDLLNLCGKNVSAGRYCMIMKSVRDIFEEKTKKENTDYEDLYELIVISRLWLTCIGKILNSKYKLVNYGTFLSKADELRKTSGDKFELIEEHFSMSTADKNIIMPLFSNDETKLIKFSKILTTYAFKSEDIFEDTDITEEYLNKVPMEIQDIISEYEGVVSKGDIRAIISNCDHKVSDLTEATLKLLSQKLMERSMEIHMYSEVQSEYDEIVEKEDNYVKNVDISTIPFDELCKVLVTREVTDDFLNYAKNAGDTIYESKEFNS